MPITIRAKLTAHQCDSQSCILSINGKVVFRSSRGLGSGSAIAQRLTIPGSL